MKKFVYLLMIFVVFLSAGCGSEKTIKTDEGSVTVEDNKIEANSEDGKSKTSVAMEGEVSLPEGYPEDIAPIIEGGKVSVSTKNEGDGKLASYSVMIFTDKDLKEATTFYKDALKDSKSFQIMESPEANTLAGEKNGYNIAVFVAIDNSLDEPRTGVNISLTPQVK